MKTDKYSIVHRKKNLKEVRRRLESSQLNAVRELLPDSTIKGICEEYGYYFRTRLLTPFVTIFHMVAAAISREGSFQSAWHNIGETGRSDSLSRARKRLPLEVWEGLAQWIADQIDDEFKQQGLWRGHRVIGIDGTCVSMSDEEELENVFGKSGSRQGRSRFPIVRVVFAVVLNTMVTIGHKVGSYRTSENSLFTEIIKKLSPGDLIIGDRRYAGAKLYVEYMHAGIEFITKAHQRLKVELLKKVDVLGNDDFIVQLPIPDMYRRKEHTLPQSIDVRVIKVKARVRGQKETFWLVTSLLYAKRYPAEEIIILYKKRWKIEELIKEIKIWLGADVLRSKTEEGIYKELYARVIAGNLIHWLMLKATKKNRKDMERISFSATVRLTASYSLKMSVAPFWMLPLLYDDLLERIANSKVACRPGRIEPRLKKRDQKHYGLLKISRKEWKAINALAA
jgi:hypothetical protein